MPLENPSPSDGVARRPPCSEEAEKGVLGSILLDAERVLDLCIERRLVPSSFYIPEHRLVFETMLAMSKEGAAVDVLTVSERLRAAGRLDTIGGVLALNRLVDSTPTSAHAEYYISIVKQKALLRQIIECSRLAEKECYESEQNADAVLGKVEQMFLEISGAEHGAVPPWNEAVKETMEKVEKILLSKRGLSGIPTGLANVDRATLGLRPGEMIVLAARPSMGKTALAMNIAANIALGRVADHTPRPVGIFSLEMSREALVLRMLCTMAEVSGFRLASGFVSQDAHKRLVDAADHLSKASIYLDDSGSLDVLDLRSRARRMWKQNKVELIVIDYLQLLHSREYQKQGRQSETADISANIKAMAKELHVPVLVLSQLNRAPEDAGGKPKLADLRDSGAIEQDADVVCFLRRPCRIENDPEHNDVKLAILDVAKQRNGPTGEVRLDFLEDYTKFRDRAHGVDGPEETMAAQRQVPEGTGAEGAE